MRNYQNILPLLSKYSQRDNPVKLVIVTKNQPIDLLTRLSEKLKNPIFGENRVQEAIPKIEAINSPNVEWHFIGHLQKNKVRKILGKFSLIHSLDNIALANEMEKRAARLDISVNCLLQIDISQNGSKFGIYPNTDIIKEFLNEFKSFSHVQIMGLMTIAPYVPPEETRIYFRQMHNLYYNLKKEISLPPNVNLQILSMGMSNDFIVALQEGSTMVRLGTAVFGESV